VQVCGYCHEKRVVCFEVEEGKGEKGEVRLNFQISPKKSANVLIFKNHPVGKSPESFSVGFLGYFAIF